MKKPPQLSLPFAPPIRPGAADGPLLDERNATAYVEMVCRSILNWSRGGPMDQVFTVNPYRGCEFGCAYCYARHTHEYLDLDDEAFERRVFVKANAPEAMWRELRRRDVLRHGIAIGTATDPWQPAERHFRITRRILEALLPYRDIPVSIVTKSSLIERDATLLGELARRHRLQVLISCISLDRELVRRLERRSPTPERRFAAMRRLVAAGVPCGIIVAPIIPGLTDDVDDLTALLGAARRSGASFVVYNPLFLNPAARQRFLPWLRENVPQVAEEHARAFYRGSREREALRDRIRQRMAEAMRRAGFLPADRPGPVREQDEDAAAGAA